MKARNLRCWPPGPERQPPLEALIDRLHQEAALRPFLKTQHVARLDGDLARSKRELQRAARQAVVAQPALGGGECGLLGHGRRQVA